MKNITTFTSTTTTTMDPRIWSKLPPDVVEHILLLLPLKTLLNLRSTCKAFSSLLFSPSFVSKHSPSSSSSSSPFSSFLLLSHPQCPLYFRLYDSNLSSWRTVSPSLPFSSSFSLASSSGGLFCLLNPSSSSFIVCNLFAKSSRTIQSPIHSLHFTHLSFLATSLTYYLVLLSSNSASNTAFVYNSNHHSWRRFQGFHAVLSDSCLQQGTFFHGGLYFTTPEPFSVVRFDLESGKWERHVAELPPQLTFVRLVSDDDGEGKLYLVGGIGADGICRSMKVWELTSDGVWVEVVALPEIMCRKFVSVCYHNYEHVYCFWHEGMICVCCYMWPEILYYSVSRRSWDWLPKCPYLPLKCSCGFKWFSFVPKLYASV
ncbi:F-box/kelch-repeat protein At5g43190 [Vigna angularis]|uniref:F-box/kelch-repeat protein At5g43190 n=1 Tax=Phaseolus angularis TaxID=3914 RepID=UPI0022B459D9|nr:F-box/kelch-repeat protein At5g43190 [Vigna angularis]